MKNNYDNYALIFKALSDSTRIEIVEMIKCEELCACNILKMLSITQPTLSYHMKMLKDVGIVKCRKKGSWMHYSLNNEKLKEVECFLKSLEK